MLKKCCMYIIKFYQKFISPMKKSCCVYYPSCCRYPYEAYEKYGFFKGTYLTVWRILRCNPFSKGGYDPVP